MKVAIYARVSTSHHGQNPEVQLAELRRVCSDRGWTVVAEIVDHGYSGGSDARPGLKRLWELARAKEIDLICVTKLDRLFRSLKHLVNALDEFRCLEIEFVSLKDNLDFTTAAGRLLFGVLACLGEFEKDLIRERTMAGLDHARRQGKHLGRQRQHDYSAIRKLRTDGLSYRAIQKHLGVGMGTIVKALGAQQTPIKNQK